MVNNIVHTRCKNAFLSNAGAICFLWSFGLFAGFFFSYVCRDSVSLLMLSAFFRPVSIVFPAACVIFLFLFFVCCQSILLLACFFKSICFGFAWMSIAYLFGSSGWIVRGLILFCDTVMNLSMLMLALDFNSQHTHKSKMIYATICLIAVLFDYIVLSPFVSGLF